MNLSDLTSLKKKLFHFFKIVIFAISETCWAICFVTINAEIAIFVSRNNCLTSETLKSTVFGILSNHAFLILVWIISMLFNALVFWTQTEPFFLSSVKNELISKIFNDVVFILLELLKIEIFNTLMTCKIGSSIFLIANLTHDKNFWAFVSNMFLKLNSRHMLKFRSIADITSKFGTMKLSMCLQFTKCFPNEWSIIVCLRASMWEFTEIDTVFQNLVHIL